MKKYSNNLIRTLLKISENQIPFTNHSSFKCFKVILYILQLFGYVYSQYESKPLTRPELDFLAQFTQLSPGTFALLQYGHDTLTKVFFYSIFSTHVLIYITILSLSLIENFDFQWIYKVLNFFFMNFMWMFMTPLQEISIGMMVCGKNSFLSYNTETSNCSVNNPTIQYFVGISGTLLVCFTGFLTVYFFRSYQFFQIDFSRRFSLLAYARLILHQIIFICYYLYLPSLDYIKHMLTHLLLLNIVLDSLRRFPFGFFYEAKFFTAAICCSEYFMLLISIWLFSDYDADILFLSFLIFQPIITTFVLMMNDRQRIQLILDFKPDIYNENSIVFLEETYRCAYDYYFYVESKVQFLFIVKCHVEQCDILNCPCQGKAEQFLDPSNNINWQILNNWTQLMFNNILSIALAERRYDDFEYFSLKFSTFLQKYKNNPILSYEILQDIQFQQSQVKKKSNQIKFKPSYYFTQIIQTIQKRNIQRMKEISNKNSHLLSKLEQCLLNNIIQLNDLGQIIQHNILKLLGIQIQFWNKLLTSNFKDFEELKNNLFILHQAKLECQNNYQQIKDDQSSQLMLRLKLIYALCCDRQYNQIIIFEKKLTQTMINESSDQISSFKASQFLQSSCYTLIGAISQQQQGLILNKIDQAFLSFFSWEVNDNRLTQISQLMPPFLGDIHQHFVVQFLQGGQGQKLNKVFSTYLQNGQGFIEQVKIIINFYFPSTTNQQQFLMMSHLRKVKFSQADPSNLDNDTNSDGIILLNKDFRIIGLTENIYDKVSSYLLKLQCTEDIMKNSNIFRMIPKLLTTLMQFYTEFASHLLDQGITEIGKFSDVIQINFDPSLQEEEKHSQKKRPLSVKERIKTLQRIQNQLECSSNRQISQSTIFCIVNQHLIQYTVNGETLELLFYELTIQLKQQSQKIHTKNEFQNRNIRGQFNMQQETNRYPQSLENIDKSEIPILSQAYAELIFDEGSVSSLQSGTDDIKLLNEFQKFSKEPHKLKLLTELLYINSAFFLLFIALVFIQLLLRQFMLEISLDCLNQQFNIQNSYIIQTSMVTLWMQSQFLDLHISQLNQSALNKISTTSQISIGDINQINNQKIVQILDDWIIYREYFNDQIMELTHFQNFKDLGTNYTYQVEKSTIRTYIMITDVLLQNYQYTFAEQFVDPSILGNALLNLVAYRSSINDFNNQCQSQYKQQSLVVFQVIIYISYVIVFLFIIYIILKLRQLQDKFWILLNVYQQLDSQQVNIELHMLSIQEIFLKQDTPWNKEQQFNEFLVESNCQIDNNQSTQNIQNNILTIQRKIHLNQKPKRIQIENQELKKSSVYLIMGLLFFLCCVQFSVTQIKFTMSFNSSSDNFQRVLSVINFQSDFSDSIFLWNIYLQNYSMLNRSSWYPLLLQSFELDYATQNTRFDILRYQELQDFIGILGLTEINTNFCQVNVFCEDYLISWENRTAAGSFLNSLLQEGLLLNIQKILNLIQQNSGFEFQVSEKQLVNLYLQQDYFIYFYWGNDIIYKSLELLIKKHVDQFIQIIDSYLFEDLVLIIISGIFAIILLFFLIYRYLKNQLKTYDVLRQSLQFIPYNVQTKLMAKHFLKILKN